MPNPIEAVACRDAVAITPSDTTVYNHANGGHLSALYIGGAGNVAVHTAGASTVTFVGAVAGSIIPVKCDQVMNTNTTATSIVGLRF